MTQSCPHLTLCKTNDVWEGVPLKIEKNGLTLAVFNIENQFFVTDDACTHGPGSLSDGEVDGDVVTCGFHNGAFNIKTGEAVLSPCTQRLKTYAVRVNADEITIAL
jgi:biphenyl 2,3-dioxygenase ferredoxin subunit